MRSATIQAEIDSVLYALSVEAYERLKSENRPLPGAAQLCGDRDDRAPELCQQGDRRLAPLIAFGSLSNPSADRLDARKIGCAIARTIELVLLLQVEPKLSGGAERPGEP